MHSKIETSAAVAARLGKVAQQERERQGLRQDELALVAGVSTRVVHQVESGKPTSRLDSLVAVLSALGVTLEAASSRDGGRSS